MGVKLPPGTVTVTPTSPSGPPVLGTVSEDGISVTLDGVTYWWNQSDGRYQQRIPPPPTNPPGEWRYLYFQADQTWDQYDTDPSTGNAIWTCHGHYTSNG